MNKPVLKQTKKHFLVSKHNHLISSKYSLSLQELRLLATLTSFISPEDTDFQKYSISVKEYAEAVGLSSKGQYPELKRIIRGLLSKPIEIERIGDHGEEVLMCSWLSSAVYVKNQGRIIVAFDPQLKPYLLQLNDCFTSMKLRNLLSLSFKHSYRIYELLKQYQTIGKRFFALCDLKEMLGIQPNQYPNWSNLRQKVIEPVQDDLFKHSDISFTYTVKKEKRSVVGIEFQIRSNKRKKISKTIDTELAVDVFDAETFDLKEEIQLIKKIQQTQDNAIKVDSLIKQAGECYAKHHGYCNSTWDNAKKTKNRDGCFYCAKHEKARIAETKQMSLNILS